MTKRAFIFPAIVILSLGLAGCRPASEAQFDVVIRNGTVYDGGGGDPFTGDVVVSGDLIVSVGRAGASTGKRVIDASGLAVAPGFINMLSWSNESLIADGRSQGEIRQGVTTQILGEGNSMGPLSPEMKKRLEAMQADIKYPITWTTLAEYLRFLESKGISQNVASFIGAATLREYAVGLEDKDPTAEQMELMRKLVRQEMAEGALGIASALIYAPGSYAKTGELIELCKVAAEYRGTYISHLRSEADRLVEAVEEFVRISREARIPAEIYHLKAGGETNWPKMERVIELVGRAQQEGLHITADMYTYTAGSTGLEACVPLWAQSGGPQAMRNRFKDPALRRRILDEMRTPSKDWENFLQLTGTPDRILLVAFGKEELKPLQGKTLAEVARLRKKDPAEVILDLLSEDEVGVGAVYFMMSEDNVRKEIRLPWMSFGSDAASMAPEGVFLKFSTHPRAYGNFARLLGKYVREEKLIPLAEAVRRLTSLPAQNLGLERRGLLKPGMFADIVVFDPQTIMDKATYENPQQYAVGVKHVLVNGKIVLENGEHTGAFPGRALWGPGKKQ
jgi:N-acyl-D-amino-acid deacylase